MASNNSVLNIVIRARDLAKGALTEGTDYNLTANGIGVIGTGAIDNRRFDSACVCS